MPTSKKKPFEIVRTIDLESLEEVVREAPEERSLTQASIIQPVLNDAQLAIMLNKTPAWAIKKRQGGGGKIYTYVPHGYVTDTLNKAFGFDWDLILDPMFDGRMYAMEIEEITDKTGKVTKTNRHMAVCGRLVIRVHDPEKPRELVTTITKSGFGSQLWLPAMELGDALKGARSDLLKTCAYQLGIALDLYWNERAEIADFEAIQNEQIAKIEKEKQILIWEKKGVPTDFGTLLSRSKQDYGYLGEQIEQILGIEVDLIMDYSPEEIVAAWETITLFNAKEKK
jgi:hypothetical protein